jgi:hypothetical protein
MAYTLPPICPTCLFNTNLKRRLFFVRGSKKLIGKPAVWQCCCCNSTYDIEIAGEVGSVRARSEEEV